MKILEQYEVKMPTYAMSYIHNNDSSGLDDSEIALIDGYLKQYYDIADKLGAHVIISCPEEEGSFTHRPAFGLACDCVETEILICK